MPIRAAAAALDWRVPDGAIGMAMFGSHVARVDVHHRVVADVDGRSPRRVEQVDRLDPSLAG